MALQCVLGAGRTGKTDYIYEQMIKESMENRDENFFFLVPDQSTLNAQRELITRHPNHGTMNIDVVGFYRLSYRVFEELSYIPKELLNDEGKSMVIRKVMGECRKELLVFGSGMEKQGFIDEMKSFFAETYQYDVSLEKLKEAVESFENRDSLTLKMKDIVLVLEKFEEYMKDRYLVSEQLLDVLAQKITESEKLKGATIYIDGFTGFTPIQNKVLKKLLPYAKKIVAAFTIDEKRAGGPYRDYELFAMPKKEISQLKEMAVRQGVPILPDVILHPNTAGSEELRHLEQNLFRYPFHVYRGETKDIKVCCLKNPKEESRYILGRIEHLVRKEGYRYKDLVVLTGDIETYQPELEKCFEDSGIPYFIDGNRALRNNPCVETILSALKMIQMDFSYDMVFRYLKSGFSALEPEETDLLENFVIASGIRGYARWNRPFKSRAFTKEEMKQINQSRETFMREIGPFKEGIKKRGITVLERLTHLHGFFLTLDIQGQMERKKEEFEAAGALAMAKTYDQIYGEVLNIMDQMAEILGEEALSFDEFCAVLETGLSEMTVGVIPPGLDQVIVGDIERTRVEGVKVLFFAGINEGVVPKPSKGGGLVTDSQREELLKAGISLAPGAANQAYMEQYYLYLAMAKPNEKLYLTYASMNSSGESKAPSYLIGRIEKLFPGLKRDRDLEETAVYSVSEAKERFVEKLQELGEEKPDQEMAALYEVLNELKLASLYLDAYFYNNEEKNLDRHLTTLLYGKELENSVTRVEKFSGCAFAHFLQYGLRLRERLVHEILPMDMGQVFHRTLQFVGQEGSWDWEDDRERDQFVDSMVERALDEDPDKKEIFESSSRNQYTKERIRRMAKRAVWAVEQQLKRGEFTPYEYELGFSAEDGLSCANLSLKDGTKMKFTGVIDRVDCYEDEENLYLKIIDYKSGNMQFDFTKILNGLQVQLVVYMNAILELEGKKHPEKRMVPAGMFYFHVDDPVIAPKTDGEPEMEVLKNLQLRGVVNEDFGLVEHLEQEDEYGIVTLPVTRTKTGYKKGSALLSTNEFKNLGRKVEEKMKQLGEAMMDGDISISPYEYQSMPCDYCAFKSICAYEPKLMKSRKLEKIGLAEAKELLAEGKGEDDALD